MNGNLKARIATAAVGLPLLVWLIAASPPWLFAAFFFVLTVGALHEYFAMTFPRDRGQRFAGTLLGVIVALAVIAAGPSAPVEYFGAVLVLGFSASLCFRHKLAGRLHPLLLMLTGAFYVGYLTPFGVLLLHRPDGRVWLAWLLFVIMAGDTAAYFVGRRFGKRKLAPALSPGKTVAGAWGYVFGSLGVGLAGAGLLWHHFSWPEMIALSLLLATLGQLGDLFESWIKRIAAVKDSGNLLPGHGGLLDRMDSLVFPVAFTTAYLRMFHS